MCWYLDAAAAEAPSDALADDGVCGGGMGDDVKVVLAVDVLGCSNWRIEAKLRAFIHCSIDSLVSAAKK